MPAASRDLTAREHSNRVGTDKQMFGEKQQVPRGFKATKECGRPHSLISRSALSSGRGVVAHEGGRKKVVPQSLRKPLNGEASRARKRDAKAVGQFVQL